MKPLWIDDARFEHTADEPMPELTLKTGAQIDAELVDRDIAYGLSFLREQGLHKEANDVARKLKHPTVVAKDVG